MLKNMVPQIRRKFVFSQVLPVLYILVIWEVLLIHNIAYDNKKDKKYFSAIRFNINYLVMFAKILLLKFCLNM